jgi:hypothetical protein
VIKTPKLKKKSQSKEPDEVETIILPYNSGKDTFQYMCFEDIPRSLEESKSKEKGWKVSNAHSRTQV